MSKVRTAACLLCALAFLLLSAGAAISREASPQPCADVPAPRDALLRLNAVRRAGAACGPGTEVPLDWDDRLADTAAAQAADLARRDELSHLDAARRPLDVRLQDVGYRLGSAAEVVAAGQPDFDAAVEAWLASESHCRSLMQPSFEHVGLACMRRSGTRYERFWVLEFGAPERR